MAQLRFPILSAIHLAMAFLMNQPRLPLYPFLFFLVSLLPFSSCQSNYNQNIETFYPFTVQTPSPAPSPTDSNNLPNPTFSPSSPPLASQEDSPSDSDHDIAKAVAATVGSTFVVAALLFFLIQRFVIAPRRRNKDIGDSSGGRPAAFNDRFTQIDRNLGGLVADENGLDVVYWRKLEGESKKNGFHKEVFHSPVEEEGEEEKRKPETVQKIPLLRGKSSTSHKKVVPEISIQDGIAADGQSVAPGIPIKAIEAPRNATSQPPNPSVPPPPAPPPPPSPPPSATVSMTVPKKQGPAPPPPPPMPANKNQAPLAPPIKGAGLPPPSKSAAVPKGIQGGSETGESSTGKGVNGQVKLKPLHWDKVNKSTDHSMVWDKVSAGSFRFDDDLMEALFGSVATNRRSTKRESSSSSPKNGKPSLPTQIVILDSRKSQNTAIVLKSLGISRQELLDALLIDGQGLDPDCVEKLTRIAPTKEEQLRILEFDGDRSRLADAESFLYHLLKAIPSAFTRLNAMLFRSNYDTEILHFKENLQTLELACKELRNRGLFVKLLEAVLKSGNRMNAGTSRGNAQAFKLTSLQKLADVKGTDRKTTLLHFVVQEVVRYEGKRCVISRNRNLSRSSNTVLENSDSKEEKEKEYMMLGLPIVGGLSAEFSNVKKAASIDYQSLAATCSGLADRTAEVKMLLPECAADGGGFGREMERFLASAEEEFKAMKEEQMRIMGLVRRTTEYYQAGSSKDQDEHPLQLFVIVKNFLNMVDHVCVEIARNLQKRKTPSSSSGSSPKSPASSRMAMRFPNLPEHFLSSSSGSDTDF